jgi:hypothetical protein
MSLEILDQYLFNIYEKPGRIETMSKRANPFLSLVDTRMQSGENFQQPISINGGRAWASSRTEAQAISNTSAGNGQVSKWISYVGKIAGNLKISHDEIAGTGGDKEATAAFARALSFKVDNHLSEFGGLMSRSILGPAGMYVFTGQIVSGVITLTSANADRVAEVELGDQLQASADDASSSAHTLLGASSIGYLTARTIEGSSPTVTVSTTPGGSAGTPAGWTESTTIYFYRVGDFKGGIDTGAKFGHRIDSIQAWVPATTSVLTTFKGVVRTQDTRLFGVRLLSTDDAVTSGNIESVLESLNDLGRSRYGFKNMKKVFMHTSRFRQLSRSLESRRWRDASASTRKSGEGSAEFSYAVISMTTTSGAYEVIDDPTMPVDYALMTDPDDWEIVTWSGFPQILSEDGVKMLRQSTADDYEMRHLVYPSFKLKEDRQISQTGRTPLPAA